MDTNTGVAAHKFNCAVGKGAQAPLNCALIVKPVQNLIPDEMRARFEAVGHSFVRSFLLLLCTLAVTFVPAGIERPLANHKPGRLCCPSSVRC